MAEWSMEDALRMALRFEEKDFVEYEKGARETSDPGVKSMFQYLANEERKHMKLIGEMMKRFDVQP